MKVKQLVLLSIALLLPICIFVFLKAFGKNEFDVPQMFAEGLPSSVSDCPGKPALPYIIPSAVLDRLEINQDSISCIYYCNAEKISRVKNEYINYPLNLVDGERNFPEEKRCIFLLEEPFDVVLVDNKGSIRGQYNSSDRDEIDRLLTESAILLRKY